MNSENTFDKDQKKALNKTDVIKSVCVHEWKLISYYNQSCSWTCKKCGKTVL